MGRERIEFSYVKHAHKTICKRKVHNKEYVGTAICHPNDYRYESELIGQHYAYVRTLIEEMCDERDRLAARLNALKHIYSLMVDNDEKYNYNDAKHLLEKQIKVVERDLKQERSLIRNTRANLKQDMEDRDEVHTRLERMREKRQTATNK